MGWLRVSSHGCSERTHLINERHQTDIAFFAQCVAVSLTCIHAGSMTLKFRLQPLYGKLSDVLGRKPMLLTALIIFIFGSAMCGAAQSMIWLVVCRGLQGIGGGGLIQMCADFACMRVLADRAHTQGANINI